MGENVPSTKVKAKERASTWPKTSDKEFSKRMFICFMWAFFIHIGATVVVAGFFDTNSTSVEVLKLCIPVYTTIFAAVIVKGGVENVFKGKELNSTTTTSSDNNG